MSSSPDPGALGARDVPARTRARTEASLRTEDDTESGSGASQRGRTSVLIPTHADAHLLAKSLPVFLADPEADLEIVVVNNDPDQDVWTAIGRYAEDARVKIVEMGEEGDYPRGVNRGIGESTGEVVMLCNADLFPSPSYLSVIEKFLVEHPEAGAAIGKLYQYDLVTDRPTGVIDSAGLILTRQRRLKARGEGELDVGQYDDEVEMFALDGAGIVLRRRALEDIAIDGEYLDSNFVAHKEDHDLSWRLRLAGWQCWYVPRAVAYHGRTTRGLGSTSYLKALAGFHRHEQTKSDRVRLHAMKNQWLLLLKSEDPHNFLRDLPFILGRELMILTHNALFSPEALRAIPLTVKLLPETLRKRRAAKAKQRMAPRTLRRWLDAPDGQRRAHGGGDRPRALSWPRAPSAVATSESKTRVSTGAGTVGKLGRAPSSRIRVAVVINAVTPYMRPLWEHLANRDELELLLVTETTMERDRRWEVENDLPVPHVRLESITLDLAWMAVGSGYKTRFDSYLYVPRRPLAPLRAFSPDVVVAAGGGVWSSPANIAVLAARSKHDWAVVPWWNTFTRQRPSLPRRVAEPWVRYFMRSGDAWLAGGSRHARDLVRLGTDPDRTVVAPLTGIGPNPSLARSGTRVPGLTRYLFVGRLIERKGIDVLLDAFRRLDAGELWLAGDGPLRAAVESEARRNPGVHFLGYADEERLPELYLEADVLVVPSLFEPWGLVVHEGLAHGLPVIATDQVAAADDLIDPGVNGFVVSAGSAEALAGAMRSLESWTEDHWLRASSRSRETLATCSIERAADAFIQGCLMGHRHRQESQARAAH